MTRGNEWSEQCAVIDWWSMACHGYKLPAFALLSVPNGSHLAGSAAQRAIKMRNLKRAGLRPGIPDLFLAATNDGFHGLWIELKRRPNKPSAEQEAVILYLRKSGYHAVIAWSADEAIQAIRAYLA